MREQRIIENLEIFGISADGKAVGRKDNLVIFVRGGAPGDVIDVEIVGKDKNFLVGAPIHFHKKSEDRTEAFCEHFGICGGCKWQHLDYQAQLKHKEMHVIENLKKISGMVLPKTEPILASEKTEFYRNKLEFTFSDKRWLTKEEIAEGGVLNRNALGFHIPKMFDKILDINKCHLQPDPSNEIRIAIKEYADKHALSFYDIRAQTGLLRNLIIRITTQSEVMVIVQFARNDQEDILKLLNYLKSDFPVITSLMYVINDKKNDTFFDLPVIHFSGQHFIVEKMDQLSFRIGPKSFYQTNSEQAHELYKKVAEYAELKGDELVYDLYTGTGTIANFIAEKAKKVVGIESVADAVTDAKTNSAINNISNTVFYSGDMRDMLTNEFIQKNGVPQVVITDPPRAGMHPNVLKALNKIKPEKIVYVSCNPATQARDMEVLSANYSVKKIQPVDMFPHTHHVENVVLLELRK